MFAITAAAALLLLAAHDAAADCSVLTAPFASVDALELDGSIDFKVQWVVDAQDVTLALSSNHSGYMGFGLGEPTSGHMVGADIVTARFVGAQVDVDDRHVPWQAFPYASNLLGVADRSVAPYFFYSESVNVSVTPSLYPELDEVDDWTVISSEQSGGCQRVVLRRALASGDNYDRDFMPGTAQPVLWAHGATPDLDFHDGNRGTLAIDFGAVAAAQASAEEPACTAPDCDQVVTLAMGDYAIPAQGTTYACRSFDMNDFIAGDRHVTAIYPDIDNTRYVHHILVHRCNNGAGSYINEHVTTQVCGGSGSGSSPLSSSCESLLYAWAVGMGPLQMPEEAGFRVGSTASISAGRFIVVEVHYDNPEQVTGETDNTAMRIHLTSSLRANDAGVVNMGDPYTRMQTLPAGQPGVIHRQGVCESFCTNTLLAPGQSLTVFSVFNHQHSHGRRMWTNQYDSSGNLKRTIAPIEYWNFGVQRSFPVNFTIERGDSFFVHGQFDTSKWPADVSFGQDSLQEMLMSFLSYYPVMEIDGLPFSVCGGARNLDEAATAIATEIGFSASVVRSYLNEPKADRMYGMLCSPFDNVDDGNSETILGYRIPVQPVDSAVYEPDSDCWSRPFAFGSAVGTECGPTAAPVAPPPSSSGNSDDPDFDLQVRPVGSLDLYWRVQEDCTVSLRLSVPGDRWVAFGFGDKMVGGKVVIAQDAASVAEHTLSSRTSLGVNPFSSGASGIVGSPQWSLENGVRTLRVNMTSIAGESFKTGCEASSSPARRRRSLAAGDTEQSVIVAYGSGLDLEQHVTEAALRIDWASGVVVAAEADTRLEAHAWLMSLVFGVCLPLLVLFPASKRPATSWFALHRGVAVLSLVGAVGGFVAAVLYVSEVGGEHLSKPHHYIGLLALLLVLANPLLGAARPSKESERRGVWLLGHRVVGYGAIGMGLINLVLGGRLVEDKEAFAGDNSVVVSIVFVAIGTVLVLGASVASVRQRRHAAVTDDGGKAMMA